MFKKFIPIKFVQRFEDLDSDWLINQNKKLLLCDIDNTLVAPDDPVNNDKVKAFISNLNTAGIEVVLISNNTEDRVNKFNEGLGLKTYPMALKPFKRTYKKIKKDFSHVSVDEMVSLGDQVMTDVLGSNRSKIDVILCEQIVEKDLYYIKANRFFENLVIKYLKKRGKWPNEDM